ncbi:aldo/keto reductase [Aestuariibius sp. HNIBRBA575]|uniref:aldo/keto reductase n=1 Tax=Aestuariibius sp. HNIBRBA575 TaxID=3233343 RepID=UPI0034A27E45
MSALEKMPQMGFGTWNRPDQEAYQSTLTALETGYRHIDGAEGYENEEFVGRAIADSGIARADLWVTTKVAPESFGPGQVRPHVEASLEKLGVGPVDLLLLHYPSIGDEYDIQDYMAQLADVYDAGLTRHIGVSNFTIHYIDKALELLGDRVILTNQVEMHPFMQNHPIVDHCAHKNIPITAFSPLARGAILDDAPFVAMASDLGITPAQLALAFLMAEGHVVIPSSSNPGRIAENFAAQDVSLTTDQIETLRSMDRGLRLVNGPWCPKWDV